MKTNEYLLFFVIRVESWRFKNQGNILHNLSNDVYEILVIADLNSVIANMMSSILK